MIQEILHVSSRCGGGKSREAIRELVNRLSKMQPVSETYLFASNTVELSNQNYSFTLNEISNYPKCQIPVKKVDYKTAVGKVADEIKNLLEGGFKGVMFISHKALAILSPQLLRDVRVVIDEVPQDLAGTLMVKHDPLRQNTSWEQYLQFSQTTNGDEIVSLVPNTRASVENLIRDIRSRFDDTLTFSVADLLEHLLVGQEPVYRGKTTIDGKPCQMYQAVYYHPLKKLVDNVSYLAVLSAQLKDTLFGFICVELLKLPIVEKQINDSTQLEKKHRNRARIIPILSGGEWSTALRKKPANEALVNAQGKFSSSTLAVGMFAQEFAERVLGHKDFMITLNTAEKMLDSLEARGIVRTTTKVHGMNHLTHLDHAVYLAATNLTPFDERIYRKFANDRSLSIAQLLRAIKIERSYETAYQCIARTSVRNQPDSLKTHTFIVPDYEYAKYIASWFEAGYASILTRKSFLTKSEYDRRAARQKRLDTLVSILTQRRNKKAKLKDLLQAASLSRAAYDNHIKEFRLELHLKGLLPSKPSKGGTLGDLYPTLKQTKL
ncbi:hypothetical protein [Vreelandella venusta]|uniref:hypothetical protein n=1 Tax=Vreelandella venusta TaxID=44935 RepID=UPI003C2BA8A0